MKKERDDFSLNRGIYDGNTGQFISYAELNIQIARLIDYLRKEHPKANRIALFMNQSADYSLCFMALYEAGLVPMPLSPDADNSPERLAGFLQGAGIDLILTTGMYHQHPFWGTEAARQFPVCTLDEITLKLANYSDTLTKTAAVNSSELGYIVNTSGSSGKPKQVLVSRGGLPFCIRGHIEALNITSEDKIAAFADVAFDAHIIEMYMAKDSGANLFIVPADCRRDLTKLAKFYQTHKITVGVFVASMLRKCEPNDFPALRVVICTGEKIDNNIIHKWRHRLLVDGYGPAENTIATWLKLIQLKETQQVVKMVMIPETSCHILKVDSTTPAEQGEEGELCIAGPGVALGYTDLELTQERFITLPEGRLRLYRTRDLACLNNDGTIDIVGRLDRQVKIYGKLVCPEEIEEAIKNSEPKKIAAVYVDAKVNDQGHPDFVAYIELRQGEEALDLAFLYEKISTYLGQTFIPTRWVFVEKLPQSPSQKTTIQGLNLSELTVLRLRGSSGQLPKAGLEEELAMLFLEILAIEAGFELFRDDNFFELGGKSLQATVMIQILRSNYRLRLSYEQFVHSATPEQLARAIRRLQAKTEKKEIIELYLERETPANAPVFLIHSLLGDAERDYERLKSSWNNPRSLYAVNARGLNDSNDMDNNLLAIGYDYYLAIKNRYPRGPKIIAGWSLGGILALLVKHFFDRDQDQSVEVVMIDSESPTLFKDMSCNAYAHYLHDLFEKKLMGQTSLKTLPLSIETLSHLPKEQQIYRLFSEVLTALRDSASATEENKRLLVLIQNLLLGVLKLRWDNKMTESHLIAATATQESRGKRLGWPDSVKMKSLSVISGDHDSIVLAPLNAKAIAEHLEKISADFQAHFMVRVFSEDLRSRSIADINNEDLRYYIPAKGCQTTRYENNFNLLEMIRDDYLGSDQKVFLLLGNAGSGKTTFVQFLAKYLKERLSNTITLYIPLACYENPARGLIEAHLKKMELTDSQIAHLKKHQKFVFIIDGYDETDKGQYQNLYATNRFDQWNAKVIIACRSSYLYNVQNYRLIFYPVKNGKPLYSGLNEINLVPFDDTQIKEYIQSFLMHPPEEIEIEEGWQDAQTHIDHIDQLPGLRELIRTPFLLRVLMEVLPQIVEEYKEKPQIEAIPLTQSKILDAFIDNLWGRQAVKLMLNGQLPEDGHDITLDFEAFSVELAKAMQLRELTRVIYRRGIEPWEEFFGNSNKAMIKAREGAPLKRISGDQRGTQIIGFIHDLLIEYFINRGLLQEFLHSQPVAESRVEHFSTKKLDEKEERVLDDNSKKALEGYFFPNEVLPVIKPASTDDSDNKTKAHHNGPSTISLSQTECYGTQSQKIKQPTKTAELLLNLIGKTDEDSFSLSETIAITRAEIEHSINDSDNPYTADFINLLLHPLNSNSIKVYPAILGQILNDYHEEIRKQQQTYAFIPLNVSYDENDSEHKNHWVAVIVNKELDLVFYLDPAKKTKIPAALNELKGYLGYRKNILMNPIDFQQNEKAEGFIRHCGAYAVELFTVFSNLQHCISGSEIADHTVEHSISLQTALSVIPCGEADNILTIRAQHIERAQSILFKDKQKTNDQSSNNAENTLLQKELPAETDTPLFLIEQGNFIQEPVTPSSFYEELVQSTQVLGEEEVLQSAIQASLVTEESLAQNPQNVLQAKRKEQKFEETQLLQSIIETEEVKMLPQPNQPAEKRSSGLKKAIANLLEKEGFTFTIRQSNKLEMTIAFTATDSVLMNEKEIKEHLLALSKLLIEELENMGLLRNKGYKLKPNWKARELQITGDDVSILNRIGILLKDTGESYWNQAQMMHSNLCFFKPQKENEITIIYEQEDGNEISCGIQ